MNQRVRVRFAPSPTGMLHIGAARTALFCWLYATQQKGDFILRIEDTDKAREVEGATENIKNSLKWLGLEWNDTYKQSERLDLYRQHAQQLLDKGLAYADPYSKVELEKFRQKAHKKGEPFLFRNFRPQNPPKWKLGMPLRFKIGNPMPYKWQDVVRGQLSAGPEALDDIVLIKADGYPTYNFAHIIDDHVTNISHVVRGEEFIASTPNYLVLHEAFGWQPPQFVTVPPILGASGTKKLSKRDGAQAVLDYKEQGYLPEALNNFLALLGWNDGSTQEIYTREELVAAFSLERIQKSGAKFNAERLEWTNAQHLRRLSPPQLEAAAKPFWPKAAAKVDNKQKARILAIERERLKTLGELAALPDYFFNAPKLSPQEVAVLGTEFNEQTEGHILADWLQEAVELIKTVGDSKPKELEQQLRQRIKQHKEPPGTMFAMLRMALTNADSTPPIWDLIHILGQAESVKRLEAIRKLL